MSKGLEVWNAVKKYMNLYHHQAVNENIDVKTVEGMPIDIIEKELKALEIIKKRDFVDIKLLKKSKSMYEYNRQLAFHYDNIHRNNDICLIQSEEEYDLLKEVLK